MRLLETLNSIQPQTPLGELKTGRSENKVGEDLVR